MKSIGTGWHVKESQLNQPEFKHFAIRHYNAEYFRVQRELQALQSKIRGLLESCICSACDEQLEYWED